MNPSCTVKEDGEGYICDSPAHDGYVHARDVNDIERALDEWRARKGEAVYDCDGDKVHRVLNEGTYTVEYAFGEDLAVTSSHVTYFLIPEPKVTPEEVEAAIESIRKTTI